LSVEGSADFAERPRPVICERVEDRPVDVFVQAGLALGACDLEFDLAWRLGQDDALGAQALGAVGWRQAARAAHPVVAAEQSVDAEIAGGLAQARFINWSAKSSAASMRAAGPMRAQRVQLG